MKHEKCVEKKTPEGWLGGTEDPNKIGRPQICNGNNLWLLSFISINCQKIINGFELLF